MSVNERINNLSVTVPQALFSSAMNHFKHERNTLLAGLADGAIPKNPRLAYGSIGFRRSRISQLPCKQRCHTRSQESGGIQCSAWPFHLTLQPMGFVAGMAGSSPASRASRASRSSWVVSRPSSRGLSSIRPV